MHILIFTSSYPNHRAAHRGVFVRQQVQALARTHQVTVIAPEFVRLAELLERRPLSEMEETVSVCRPRCWYVRGIWWFFYLLTSFRCAYKVAWATVDVVHAHFAIPAGFTAAWLSHWYRKPFVLTLHFGRFAFLVAPLLRRLTVHWTIKQAQRVVVVSRALQRSVEHEGVTGRFVVVPNIVDPSVFYLVQRQPADSSGGIHLLWVGSLAPTHYRNKGVLELLQAVALVCPRVAQDIRLTLIGDGAARVECETEARRLGIADVCDFVGTLPHTQVRDWMQRCDALVLVSHIESFGVVLIEAMACGKPVVATRCGGPEEIVTPETGILVDPGDPQALADGIARLVENYHTYDPEQIAAYAHAHFNPERIARMLTQVYNDLCYTQSSG